MQETTQEAIHIPVQTVGEEEQVAIEFSQVLRRISNGWTIKSVVPIGTIIHYILLEPEQMKESSIPNA